MHFLSRTADASTRIMTNHKKEALERGMLYTVSDVPPAPMGVMLGFQHFLTMLGATAVRHRLCHE